MDSFPNGRQKASGKLSFAKGQRISDDEEPSTANRRVIEMNDPLDAMSMNRAQDKLVAAGSRGILQIIKLAKGHDEINENPYIIKECDLRSQKRGKINILFSASNVSWNKIQEQHIATTSSNGSVVVWDVTKKTKYVVYKSHERSATCIDWSHYNPYMVFSGSRDCHVYGYDSRVPGEHQIGFWDGTCEAIRDIAFANYSDKNYYFFTGDDSGALRLWDMRNNSRWVLQRTAHNAFVCTIAVSPVIPSLVATGGGRDKLVKVWNWDSDKLEREYVVETMAPLGRVVWRKENPYHIATCASVNDMNIHIWDIRRPFIPYATYDEHRDSVTDVCFPRNQNSHFLSCGKDGLLILHALDSGHVPISYACDVPLDVAPDGAVAVALNVDLPSKDQDQPACLPRRRMIRKMSHEAFDGPVQSVIACGVPSTCQISMQPTMIAELAKRYFLGGKSANTLCTLNFKIAKLYGNDHIAQTWNLVNGLLTKADIRSVYSGDRAKYKMEVKRKMEILNQEMANEGKKRLPNFFDMTDMILDRMYGERRETMRNYRDFKVLSSDSDDSSNESLNSESSDDIEVFVEPKDPDAEPVYTEELTLISRRKPGAKNKYGRPLESDGTMSDFYFGGAEVNMEVEDPRKETVYVNEFMGLRDEAYEMRNLFSTKKRENVFDRRIVTLKEGEEWTPMFEIYRLLLYHAEQGDIQTCACVAIVCGRKFFDVVDSYTVGCWIDTYLELCERLELFVTMAQIRKYSPIYRIGEISREGTLIEVGHKACGKAFVDGRCQGCGKSATPQCTLCRRSILGLTFQCELCLHAMHPNHAVEHFEKHNTCADFYCLCECPTSTYPYITRYFYKPKGFPIDVSTKSNLYEGIEDENEENLKVVTPFRYVPKDPDEGKYLHYSSVYSRITRIEEVVSSGGSSDEQDEQKHKKNFNCDASLISDILYSSETTRTSLDGIIRNTINFLDDIRKNNSFVRERYNDGENENEGEENGANVDLVDIDQIRANENRTEYEEELLTRYENCVKFVESIQQFGEELPMDNDMTPFESYDQPIPLQLERILPIKNDLSENENEVDDEDDEDVDEIESCDDEFMDSSVSKSDKRRKRRRKKEKKKKEKTKDEKPVEKPPPQETKKSMKTVKKSKPVPITGKEEGHLSTNYESASTVMTFVDPRACIPIMVPRPMVESDNEKLRQGKLITRNKVEELLETNRQTEGNNEPADEVFEKITLSGFEDDERFKNIKGRIIVLDKRGKKPFDAYHHIVEEEEVEEVEEEEEEAVVEEEEKPKNCEDDVEKSTECEEVQEQTVPAKKDHHQRKSNTRKVTRGIQIQLIPKDSSGNVFEPRRRQQSETETDGGPNNSGEFEFGEDSSDKMFYAKLPEAFLKRPYDIETVQSIEDDIDVEDLSDESNEMNAEELPEPIIDPKPAGPDDLINILVNMEYKMGEESDAECVVEKVERNMKKTKKPRKAFPDYFAILNGNNAIDQMCFKEQLKMMKKLKKQKNVFQLRKEEEELTEEFIKLYYFIPWNLITKSENQDYLRKVFFMFERFKTLRKRVCTVHFNDFKFNLMAYSISMRMRHILFNGTYNPDQILNEVDARLGYEDIKQMIYEQRSISYSSPEELILKPCIKSYAELQTVVKSRDSPDVENVIESIESIPIHFERPSKVYINHLRSCMMSSTIWKMKVNEKIIFFDRQQEKWKKFEKEALPLLQNPRKKALPVCQIEIGDKIVQLKATETNIPFRLKLVQIQKEFDGLLSDQDNDVDMVFGGSKLDYLGKNDLIRVGYGLLNIMKLLSNASQYREKNCFSKNRYKLLKCEKKKSETVEPRVIKKINKTANAKRRKRRLMKERINAALEMKIGEILESARNRKLSMEQRLALINKEYNKRVMRKKLKKRKRKKKVRFILPNETKHLKKFSSRKLYKNFLKVCKKLEMGLIKGKKMPRKEAKLPIGNIPSICEPVKDIMDKEDSTKEVDVNEIDKMALNRLDKQRQSVCAGNWNLEFSQRLITAKNALLQAEMMMEDEIRAWIMFEYYTRKKERKRKIEVLKNRRMKRDIFQYIPNDVKKRIFDLHSAEIRRLANKAKREKKEEYLENKDKENPDVIKNFPTSALDTEELDVFFMHFLLSKEDEEELENELEKEENVMEVSEEDVKLVVDSSSKLFRIDQLARLLAQHGVYLLKKVSKRNMRVHEVRKVIGYILRRLTDRMKMSKSALKPLVRDWFRYSKGSYEEFGKILENHVQNRVDRETHALMLFVEKNHSAQKYADLFDELVVSECINHMLTTIEMNEMKVQNEIKPIPIPRYSEIFEDVFDDDEEMTTTTNEEMTSTTKSSTQRKSAVSFLDPETGMATYSEVWTRGIKREKPLTRWKSADCVLMPYSDKCATEHKLKYNYRRLSFISDIKSIGSNNVDSENTLSDEKYKNLLYYTLRMHQSNNSDGGSLFSSGYSGSSGNNVFTGSSESTGCAESVGSSGSGKCEEIFEDETVTEENFVYNIGKNDKELEFSEQFLHKKLKTDRKYYEGTEQMEWEDVIHQFGITINEDALIPQIKFVPYQSIPQENAHISSDEDSEAESVDSYCSMKHCYRHELYFNRERSRYRLPGCVVSFSPEEFFIPDMSDVGVVRKWQKIIEASNSAIDFNGYVLRQRLIAKCRSEFLEKVTNKYKGDSTRLNLKIFDGCFIYVITDIDLNPWVVHVVEKRKPQIFAVTLAVRQEMLNDFRAGIMEWRQIEWIDNEVLRHIPLISTTNDLEQQNSRVLFEMPLSEEVRREWFRMNKQEGIEALNAIIRMKRIPPENPRRKILEKIFKPIYDNFYEDWVKVRNNPRSEVIFQPKISDLERGLIAVKYAYNYAYQFHLILQCDPVISKTKSKEFGVHLPMFRQDVPSSSLLKGMREAIMGFVNAESQLLPLEIRRQVLNRILQITQHGSPNEKWVCGEDESEGESDDDDDDDEEKNKDFDLDQALRDPKFLEQCIRKAGKKKRMQWEPLDEFMRLKKEYDDRDINYRIFMCKTLFEIAKNLVAKTCPKLGNIEQAKYKFQKLLQSHTRTRPLFDMMLSEIDGVQDFIPPTAREFLEKYGIQKEFIEFGVSTNDEMKNLSVNKCVEEFEVDEVEDGYVFEKEYTKYGKFGEIVKEMIEKKHREDEEKIMEMKKSRKVSILFNSSENEGDDDNDYESSTTTTNDSSDYFIRETNPSNKFKDEIEEFELSDYLKDEITTESQTKTSSEIDFDSQDRPSNAHKNEHRRIEKSVDENESDLEVESKPSTGSDRSEAEVHGKIGTADVEKRQSQEKELSELESDLDDDQLFGGSNQEEHETEAESEYDADLRAIFSQESKNYEKVGVKKMEQRTKLFSKVERDDRRKRRIWRMKQCLKRQPGLAFLDEYESVSSDEEKKIKRELKKREKKKLRRFYGLPDSSDWTTCSEDEVIMLMAKERAETEARQKAEARRAEAAANGEVLEDEEETEEEEEEKGDVRRKGDPATQLKISRKIWAFPAVEGKTFRGKVQRRSRNRAVKGRFGLRGVKRKYLRVKRVPSIGKKKKGSNTSIRFAPKHTIIEYNVLTTSDREFYKEEVAEGGDEVQVQFPYTETEEERRSRKRLKRILRAIRTGKILKDDWKEEKKKKKKNKIVNMEIMDENMTVEEPTEKSTTNEKKNRIGKKKSAKTSTKSKAKKKMKKKEEAIKSARDIRHRILQKTVYPHVLLNFIDIEKELEDDKDEVEDYDHVDLFDYKFDYMQDYNRDELPKYSFIIDENCWARKEETENAGPLSDVEKFDRSIEKERELFKKLALGKWPVLDFSASEEEDDNHEEIRGNGEDETREQKKIMKAAFESDDDDEEVKKRGVKKLKKGKAGKSRKEEAEAEVVKGKCKTRKLKKVETKDEEEVVEKVEDDEERAVRHANAYMLQRMEQYRRENEFDDSLKYVYIACDDKMKYRKDIDEKNSRNLFNDIKEKFVMGPFEWQKKIITERRFKHFASMDRKYLAYHMSDENRERLDELTNIIRKNCRWAHKSWGPFVQLAEWEYKLVEDEEGEKEEENSMKKDEKDRDPLMNTFLVVPRIALLKNCVRLGVRCTPLAIGIGLGASLRRLKCEAVVQKEDPWLLVPEKKVPQSSTWTIVKAPITLVLTILQTLRKLIRCVSLFLRFAPILVIYPIASRIESLEEVWWKLLLWSVQNSGPTFVKLGQWASTRRDIFSKKFCDRLSILHIQTKKKRLFRDKVHVFNEIFGKEFMEKHGDSVFPEIEPYSIGSGCIAQVFRGTMNVAEFEKATGQSLPTLAGRKHQKVAVKVADKGVRQKIELDLSILRSVAFFLQMMIPSFRYLDPMGALEQFEMVLRRQVDLSNEAKALKKFSENFDPKETGILFPTVLGYTRNAILETYEDGVYINRIVAEEGQTELKARQSTSVRRRIALMGARALLKMIFVDNFVHGDLHPGNILIRFNDDENGSNLEGVHKAPRTDALPKRLAEWFRSLINYRSTPKIRFTDSPDLDDEPTLVLLDTGIAISETPKNLNNLKSLFRCVVEKKGYDVGRLLLSQSPHQQCKDPDTFCKQVEKLVLKARSEKSLRTLNISALLSEMFSIVAEHKVELDSSFTTVVLSVMVLEGFGRSLDPDLDLFQLPPLRPEAGKNIPRTNQTWLEEYLEGKDEILLYITAALGVFLPGIVYFLYYKCHSYYEKYAEKKEKERIAEMIAQSETAVIVLGSENGQAHKYANLIYTRLTAELVRPPALWMSDSFDVKKMTEFKGFCIYVVDTLTGGSSTESSEWFLEWLEDLAANSKMKKKSNFDTIRFAIVGFGSSDDGRINFNKTARTLLKRMKILGSKQIIEVEIHDTKNDEVKVKERMDEFVVELLDAIEKYYPNNETYTDSEGDLTDGTEFSDEDFENDGKKLK
ncbi:unnamed protein product [Caenorhabditis bovis]|uniref:Flavodoxin-like domain-containing protein n=1 Tax=Caenorhabditis bovis TaxID=2654633 RepID=A0A8S1ESQ5_9PELO|nr:unnamed protein product [Caenorhabditis bovis]